MFSMNAWRTATRSACAIALAGLGLMATSASASASDLVRITDPEVDFGGLVYSFGAPVGPGNLDWNHEVIPAPPPMYFDQDYYRPVLDGTLHVDNADDECGRIHMETRTASGQVLEIEHSSALCAYDNQHHHAHVNLGWALPSLMPAEVRICTEIGGSAYGSFSILTCQTEYN